MCILIFLVEMTGSLVIYTYGERLLVESGFSAQPGVPLVFLALVRVLSSAVASLLVEKLGRRPLLIGSALFIVLGEFATGLNFYLKSNLKWLSLVGLFVQLIILLVRALYHEYYKGKCLLLMHVPFPVLYLLLFVGSLAFL